MSHGPWQIRLLGELRLARDGVAVDETPTNQAAELLAQLAERVGRQISRAELTEELWPDADVDLSRNRFRVLLSNVRRLLEPEGTPPGDVLFANRTVICLSESTCEVDVDRFTRHAHLAARASTSEERMAHYRAADDLYRGEFMSGRSSTWILSRRAHYARVQALAQYRYSGLLEESGDSVGALEQIARSIEADPLREAPRRRALRMLVEAGDIGAALAQFDEFQALLKRSLGLSPTREFQDWIRSLRAGAQPAKTGFELGGPGQENLEAAFERAQPPERELFCALTVFHGGFESIAAGSVCGASLKELQRLAALGLLAKVPGSDGSRHAVPESFRAFGWTHLTPEKQEELQNRHATYYQRLIADAAMLHLNSGIQQRSRVRIELDNLRATIDWYVKHQDAETAPLLVFGLVGLWIDSGLQREGRETARRVRNALSLNALQTAYLDATEGVLASFQDNPAEGKAFIQRALPAMENAGVHIELAGVRWLLGYCAYLSGEFEESLRLASQIRSVVGPYRSRSEAYRNNLVGFALLELGRLDEAEPILKDVRRQWQDLGDLLYADYCRLNLARLTWKRGQHEAAWNEYAQLAAAFLEWNDPRGVAYAVEGLGRVAADNGKFASAARLLGAADGLRESSGLSRDVADERAYDRAVELACRAVGSAYGPEWEAGYALAPERVSELF